MRNSGKVLFTLIAVCIAGCTRSTVNEAVEASNKGDSHLELNEYPKAIEAYTEAIKLDPSKPDLYYNRGVAYFKSEQYGEAIADMQQVIAKDPKLTFAYYYAGQSYALKGEMDKAVETFSRGIELNTNEPLLFLGRANAYKKLERQAEADADFDKVQKLSPQLLNASQ